MWLQMINLIFVLQMHKGCSYGNQLSFEANSKTNIYHLHSLIAHSTMKWTIAMPVCALTAAMIQPHGFEICELWSINTRDYKARMCTADVQAIWG